jgi:recombinational DNA repair protein RecR
MPEINNHWQAVLFTTVFRNGLRISPRLAWAFGVSMPNAIDIIIRELSSAYSSSVICPHCKDKTKCGLCAFCQSTVVVV